MTVTRRHLLGAALVGGAFLLWDRPPGPAWLTVPPLPLPPEAPLQSLGGLHLRREGIGFGGFSGLRIDDDLRLTAVSDGGHWLQARLLLDADLRPRGLAELRSGPLGTGLPIPLGFPLAGRFALDAESLERRPGGGWLVGFERWHRFRAYEDWDDPGRLIAPPPGLRDAPPNASLESLAILTDGRWLVIAEGAPHRVWLGRPETGWTSLSYAATPGFDPTDAAALPDGGALVLERRFSLRGGFAGRLMRLAAPSGDVLRPEVVLDTLPGENWEGVASFRHAGRDLVAILADDNEIFLQKGLLLLFAWKSK